MTDAHTASDPDDELVPIEDDTTEGIAIAGGSGWQILIVDDDADVHQATSLALRDLTIEGRRLQLMHAYSARDALNLIARHDDIAVVLLDVVMESEDAGLQLVRALSSLG